MSNEVVPYSPPSRRLSIAEVEEIASTAFNSLVFGNLKNPKQAAVAILTGQELGLGPMASLNAIHLIGDKPTVSANFMMAMVKRSRPRYDFRPVERTAKGAKILWYQDGEEWGESDFREDDARLAGLIPPNPNNWPKDKMEKWVKSGWPKYPKAMYLARAMGIGFRLFAGDLAFGGSLYTTEELSDQIHPDDAGIGGDVIDTTATVVSRGRLKSAIQEAVVEQER